MTTLVAWTGADQRAPASVYLGADSRISWSSADSWDGGQKVFFCTSRPHVVGFAGDVLFATQMLGRVVTMIDQGVIVSKGDDVQGYVTGIRDALMREFNSYPASLRGPLEIVHAMRLGEGLSCSFWFTAMRFAIGGQPEVRTTRVSGPSDVISVHGSGCASFYDNWSRWRSSEIGGTSRSVYYSLVDSIASGKDVRSGGPVQLVGLYRQGPGRPFGSVIGNRRYLLGHEIPPGVGGASLSWRNEQFEISDPLTLRRVAAAQPQPRPDVGP